MEYLEKTIPDTKQEKIILTGGTEGIGKAVAIELATRNHRVAICARTEENLDVMRDDYSLDAYQIDLADTEKINDFVADSSEKIGGTSILILNAAISGIKDSDDYTLKVDRDAQEKLVEASAGFLRDSGGRIVFITSSQAQERIEENKAYGEAKKQVQDWLKNFSDREENQNIHIFSINPGPVDTKMHEEAINFSSGVLKDRSERIKKEGKLRNPEIVGRIVAKMSLSGNKFNPETTQYDIPVSNNEIVLISQENIDYETQLNN